MDARSDMQLLRDWLDHRDREAISELIRRHIDFVLATARRQVGYDSHLAEDITQAVFILFLQKATHIKSEAAMASWLFTTTRFAASNARRMIRRREYYERQAAIASRERQPSAPDPDLEPLLNEAIAWLPIQERQCVVMSYLQQKSYRQVAEAMGVSEEAARMRVSRAMRRMRDFFASRSGEVIGEGAMASLLIAGHTSTASAALVESTINVVTLSQATIQANSAMAIAKGVSKMFFAMKVKAAAAIAMVVFGGAVTAQVVERALTREAAVAVTGQVQVPEQSQAPVPAAIDPSRVDLGDGAIVSFGGISPFPETPTSWRSLDGKPIQRPPGSSGGPVHVVPSDVKFAFNVRIDSPNSDAIDVSMPNCTVVSVRRSDMGQQHVFELAFIPKDGAKTIEIRVGIADGQWNSVARLDTTAADQEPWQRMRSVSTPLGSAIVSPAIDREGNASFFISADRIEGEGKVIAIDTNGLPHMAIARGGQFVDRFVMSECGFDVPAVMIRSLEIQARPFSKRVIAKNISLDPANPTKAEIVVEKGIKPKTDPNGNKGGLLP